MNHLPNILFERVCNFPLARLSKDMTPYQTNQDLLPEELDRIIEMAWEDRTPFEAIRHQFGLSESDTIALMRRTLKPSSFKNWRKRVNSAISQKHLHRRPVGMSRFKCNRQRDISFNKISKR